MKNIIYAFAALLFVACGTQAPCECEKETNGFGPFEGQSVYSDVGKVASKIIKLETSRTGRWQVCTTARPVSYTHLTLPTKRIV